MAKVSVIIPNYNHAIYLPQRISSVLNQTYTNFEVIILDDCSTDNSREVLEKYKYHPNISRIVFNKRNSGSTFKQWQKGISLAKGEYIWIAESDDWCEPTLLETLMDGLLRHPNTGLAFCQSCYYFESNKIKEFTYYPYYENVETGSQFIQQYMLGGNKVVNASMAVWKKSLYHDIDPEFTDFKFCGDWLFWISLMQRADVFVSGRVLNYFRNHAQDVSTKFYSTGNSFIENIRLYDILRQRKLINQAQFQQLIRKQYNVFLSVKNLVNQANVQNIYKAFGKYMPVNNGIKWYYELRLRLYFIKQYLLAKPANQ